MQSTSILNNLFAQKRREQNLRCSYYLEKFQDMVNYPQEYHGSIGRFNDTTRLFYSVPENIELENCPGISKFFEEVRKNNPRIKFDVTKQKLSYCSTSMDMNDESITYRLS